MHFVTRRKPGVSKAIRSLNRFVCLVLFLGIMKYLIEPLSLISPQVLCM